MAPPDDFGQMPTGDFSRIQELCEQLEQAWKEFDGSTDGVDLEPFLRTAGETLRLSVLYELIKTEMPHRHKNGLPWDLAFYLTKYPELGGADSLSPSLILEECLVRKRQGMQFSVASYQKRFARQFPELEKLLQKHDSAPIASPAAPAETASPLFGISPGRTIANHYVVRNRLGGGAYGEVWKIVDTNGGIEKALKIIMHSMDTEEAKTELQALEKIKNLESPFILRPESYWVEEGRLLIVMELARGGSLRDCLKKRKQEGHTGLAVPELLRYIREAADALDYLHGEKIVHRDIKPDNILLVGNHAKIADMGLAKLLSSERSTMASPLGSAPYMATEVWNERVSSRSDQYSLVVSYAELRQGKLPFKGNKITDFFMAHVSGRAQFEPGIILEAEQEVILKGLSKDPAQRFISCSDFVEELVRVVPRPDKGMPSGRAAGEPSAKKPTPSETSPGAPAPSKALPRHPPAPNPAGHFQPVAALLVHPEAETAVQTLDHLKPEPPSSRPDTESRQPEFHSTATPIETSSTPEDIACARPPAHENKKTGGEETKQVLPVPPTTGPARVPETVIREVANTAVKVAFDTNDSAYGTLAPDALAKRRSDTKPAEAPPRVLDAAAEASASSVAAALDSKPASATSGETDDIESAGRAAMVAEFGARPKEARGPTWQHQKAKTQNDPAKASLEPAVVDVKLIAKPAAPPRARSKALRRLAQLALIVGVLVGLGVMAAIVIPRPDPAAAILRVFEGRIASSTNTADFEVLVAEVGNVDLDMENRQKLLVKVKDAWLSLANDELMRLDFADTIKTAAALRDRKDMLLTAPEIARVKTISDQADNAIYVKKLAEETDTYLRVVQEIDPDLPDKLRIYLKKHIAKEWKTFAGRQPCDTVEEKEKALPIWMGLAKYDDEFRGTREDKQTDLVDSLLKRSKDEEWKAALASLQKAEKYASGLPRAPDLHNRIQARRTETINKYREPILQKAEQALKEKKTGARTLLEDLRQKDEALGEFKLDISPDMRTNSLWALVHIQSNDDKENDEAIGYFRKVNNRDNPLLDILCRDFCDRLEKSAGNDFKNKAKDLLTAVLPNLSNTESSKNVKSLLARLDRVANLEGALRSARGAIYSKDKPVLDTGLQALRDMRPAIDRDHEPEFYKLFTDLAEKYVTGKVDFQRADLSILEDAKEHDVNKVFPRAMATYITTACQSFPVNNDWKTRFDDCLKADQKDLWVEACIQECLFEDKGLRKAHPADVRTDIRGDGPYIRYVRGIITKSPAAFLEKETLDPNKHTWFAVDKRRVNAATVLKDAATNLRNKNKDGFYAAKTTAGQAYSYLVLAGKWLNAEASFKAPDWKKVPALELTFAALFKPDPEWDLGTKMANEVLRQPATLGDKESKLLRLVTAPSSQAIRDEIRSRAGMERIAWMTPLNQAVTLAEGAGAKIHLAKLLAFKGWLLLDPDNRGTVADPKQAFEAFNEAYELDAQSAYLIGRIDANIAKAEDTTKDFWSDLKKDSDKLPPNQPGSYRVAARIGLSQSRLEDSGKQVALLKNAHETLAQAWKLGKDENWPEILYLQSMISLELGNYLYRESRNGKRDENWKKYIQDASEFAETCAKDFPEYKPGKVQLALGHAREDVAHYCNIDAEANFVRADKAFAAAIGATAERWADPWMARGRALYRWSELKRGNKSDAQLTKQALADITKIRTGALAELTESLKQNPSDRAKKEAHYWAGVIWMQNNDVKKAQEAFELAKDRKHPDISLLALQGLADLSLGEGRRLKQVDPKEAKKKADHAKAYIDEFLALDESLESRNILATWGTLVIESLYNQNPRKLTDKSAAELLKQALPKRDAKNATPPNQIRLLNKYVDVQLTLAKGDKEQLVSEMDFALECLKRVPESLMALQDYKNLKAETHYMAARARLEGTKTPKNHRFEAVGLIRRAVEYGETHPDLFGFRVQLALQLYELMKVDDVNREAYRVEAIKELDEALKISQEKYKSFITARKKEIVEYR